VPRFTCCHPPPRRPQITQLVAQDEALIAKVAPVALTGVDDPTVCAVMVQVEPADIVRGTQTSTNDNRGEAVAIRERGNSSGAGWLDEVAEPVSAVTVGRTACDGGHQKIVLGTDGVVRHRDGVTPITLLSMRRAAGPTSTTVCFCVAPITPGCTPPDSR